MYDPSAPSEDKTRRQLFLLPKLPLQKVLAFRNQTFRLTSWAKLKQLEAIKDVLQGGFLVGFARNPVIHDIFDIDADVFDAPLVGFGGVCVCGGQRDGRKEGTTPDRRKGLTE